jgi:hypothetical protein
MVISVLFKKLRAVSFISLNSGIGGIALRAGELVTIWEELFAGARAPAFGLKNLVPFFLRKKFGRDKSRPYKTEIYIDLFLSVSIRGQKAKKSFLFLQHIDAANGFKTVTLEIHPCLA